METNHSKDEENITCESGVKFHKLFRHNTNQVRIFRSLMGVSLWLLENTWIIKYDKGGSCYRLVTKENRKIHTKWHLWLNAWAWHLTYQHLYPILLIWGLPVIMAATTQSTVLLLLLVAGTWRAAQVLPMLFGLLKDPFVWKCAQPAQQFPIYLKDRRQR